MQLMDLRCNWKTFKCLCGHVNAWPLNRALDNGTTECGRCGKVVHANDYLVCSLIESAHFDHNHVRAVEMSRMFVFVASPTGL